MRYGVHAIASSSQGVDGTHVLAMSMASRNAFPQGRQWGGKGQLLLDVQRSKTTCPPPSDGLPGGRRRLTLLLGSILEVFRGGEGYLCRPARPDVRRHPGRPLRAHRPLTEG